MHSTARAAAAATSRTKKLARAKDDLGRLVSGLGGRFYPSEQKVTARLQQIARDRKVGPYLRYTVGTAPAAAAPSAASRPARRAARRPVSPARPDPVRRTPGRAPAAADPANPPSPGGSTRHAIDAEAATDGWYALLTSLDASITAAEVLLRYKAQEAVERRYGNLKGPLAVAPMFLNSNRRIAALITVISLALLVFCLIEREARRNLAPRDQTRRTVQPAARPAHRPAHPDRPGRHAADPGHRDQPGADPQAQPGPGPAAGTARRRPDPPAITRNPGPRT